MRQFRALPLMLACVLIFSACAGGDAEDEADLPLPSAPAAVAPTAALASIDATAPSGEPVVIGFGAQEYTRASYQPLIDLFNNDNPDLHVEFVPIDALVLEGNVYTYNTEKIVRAVDVAETSYTTESDVKRGLLLDLKPFVEADASFNSADFYPAALRELNGSIYKIGISSA